MRAAVMLKQGVFPWLLVVILLATVGGCAAPAEEPPTEIPSAKEEPVEIPPAEEEGEIRRVIEVKADGLILHYLRQSFWGKKEFSSYLANQTQFEFDFKESFEQELSQSRASASDYSFSFDSATRSTVIRCDIHDAISLRAGGKYYAQFEWLLKPLGLDFINDEFEESANGLSWQGLVKGVPTTVTVELPTINDSVYKAWDHPIGHCHAHVWWSD